MRFQLFLEQGEESLKDRVLQFIKQNDGVDIAAIINGLDLPDEETLQGYSGFTFNQGHHLSPLNQALVQLRDAGLVTIRVEGGFAQKPVFYGT